MKRTLALALACALSVSLLSACGGKRENDSGSISGSVSSQPAADSAAAAPPDTSVPDGSVQPAQESTPAAVLSLNKSDFTLSTAGSTYRLKFTCEPDIDAIPEYTSSSEAVASVAQDGTVTAVAPGQATITLRYGNLTASCIVRCQWKDSSADGGSDNSGSSSSSDSSSSSGSSGSSDSSGSGSSASQVDLADFYAAVSSQYEMSDGLTLAEGELLDAYFPGLSAIDTVQCYVYLNMISLNLGEIALIQVRNSDDTAAVKTILQGRIDYMADGGAWYPEPTEIWTNKSAVVSNGSYIMLIVHEDFSAIADDFNALF